MNLVKILSTCFALLVFLNSVDVHALSHVLEADEHNQIENCQTCEEFVVSTKDNASIVPQITSTPLCIHPNFFEKPLLTSTTCIFINQEKHLGKFHNKPPPSLV